MAIQAEQIETQAALNVDLIRRWGGSASDAVLDPACKFFSIHDVDGLIGYREESGCVIAYGDPVCSPNDLQKLIDGFHHHFHPKNIIYITATKDFVDWAMEHGCHSYIEFGEELIIDPFDDPREQHGGNASLVRRKVRHAFKEGIVVKEYTDEDPKIKKDIEHVGLTWLESRSGPQIHTSNVFLFSHEKGKRWFYAEQKGKIVGVLVLNQLQAHQGWLLNHVMFTPEAAHGCPESLVVAALDALREEGCHFVTFGAVPAKALGQIVGLGKFSSGLARLTFNVARKIFHLDGRKKFWSKYHPQSKPLFLLFRHSNIGLQEIRALVRALHVKL